MQTNNGSISVVQLILQGLKIANQVFGSVIILCILTFICGVVVAAMTAGAVFFLGKSPLVWLIQIPLILVNALIGIVFSSALIQIIADRIDGTGFGVLESFKSAFVPSFYFVISSIIMAIPFGIILIGAVLSNSIIITALVYVALALGMLPFMFTQHALVLRSAGPIEALQYSWRVASAHYIKILLTLISLFFLLMMIILACVCVVKMVFPQILTNFAMLQMQAMMAPNTLPLPYILGGVVLSMILQLYILVMLNAVITSLFLQLDSIQFMPEDLTPLQADPQVALDTQMQAQSVPNTAATAIPQNIQPEAIFDEVSVTQASINTQPDDDTIRHLDSVYTASEHSAQVLEQEEDRMPTILFDEDMARQLEENERKMKQQQAFKAKKEEEDGNQSIKMSDGQL